MNRQIKFRVYDRYLKRWLIPFEINASILSIEWKAPEDSVGMNDRIWQQYTGLKDVNGKEIYEGDIVLVSRDCGSFDESRYEDMKLEVKFNPHKGFRAFWGHEDCNSEYLFSAKILGNIFESPEILNS